MANDFNDSRCVALWKFDNDATDSVGSNDLTEINSPTYDSEDKKEGDYSTDCEKGSTQYFKITDGDLDAGFPGKNGTSETDFSICLWVKFETVGVLQGLVSKYALAEYSYLIYLDQATSKIAFAIGYNNGTQNHGILFGTACTTGKWYHIGATYRASDDMLKLRIWDDDAESLLGANKVDWAPGGMTPDTADVYVGNLDTDQYGTSYVLDGKLDELVFFNSFLSDDDVDEIRSGVFVGNQAAGSAGWVDYKIVIEETAPVSLIDRLRLVRV